MLGPRGFCCVHAAECEASAKDKGLYFAPGQLSYVGAHYGLSVAGRPFRILVIAMDTGGTDSEVTMERRREHIQRVRFSHRNQHMSGTTLALRVLLGSEDWSAPAGELWGESVHVLDSYAMANLRLCSAVMPGSRRSRGTRQMSVNCLEHLRATVQILEPTVIVVEGKSGWPYVARLMSAPRMGFEELGLVDVAGVRVVLASFKHPSTPRWNDGNWSSPDCLYFTDTVLPALRQAQELALNP